MTRQPAPRRHSPTPPVVCEICTAHASEAGILAEIAKTCARELAQPLLVKTVPASSSSPNTPSTHTPANASSAPAAPLITLQLPVTLAASQHEIWCLACRLACFCPTARVSVFVSATDLFAQSKAKTAPSTRAPASAPATRRRTSIRKAA